MRAREHRRGRSWRRLLAPVTLALALIGAGCRQDMHDQPVIEPFEASAFFRDEAGSRIAPEGTIPRGLLKESSAFWSGVDQDGQPVQTLPVDVTRNLLDRGQSRYNAFCSPCHDRAGNGRGMVVRRGFKQPSSFHEERLRAAPVGYFYNVISNGFGQMSSYASQIQPSDRWAVVAYLKTLQWSRGVALSDLPESLRARVEADLHADTTGPAPEAEHGE